MSDTAQTTPSAAAPEQAPPAQEQQPQQQQEQAAPAQPEPSPQQKAAEAVYPPQGEQPVPPQGETPPAEQAPPQGQETPQQAAPETPPKPGEQGAEPGTEQADQPAAEIKVPEGLPPQLAEQAMKLGMTQEQFDGTVETFQTSDVARQQAQIQMLNQQGQQYIEENWGDQKETNINIAKQALKTFDATGELSKILRETGFGSHPLVLEFMKSVGEKLQEGGFIQSEINRPQPKRSPAAILYGDNHPVANQ